MLLRIWNSIKSNPGRAALGLAIVLGLINAALVFAGFRNGSAANRLEVEVVALEDNLAQLRQVEQDGLKGLEEQVLAVEDELAILKKSFPEFGEPFDIYRQGFALAEENLIEIGLMETGSTTMTETPIGVLEITTYRVDGTGQHLNCIGLLGSLEHAGLATLVLNEINIGIEDQECDFEVVLGSSVDVGRLPEEADLDG